MSANDKKQTVGDDVAQTEELQENVEEVVVETPLAELTPKEMYDRLAAVARTKSAAMGVPMEDIRRMMYKVFDDAETEHPKGLEIKSLKDVVYILLLQEYEGDEEMEERLAHDKKEGNIYRKVYQSCKKPHKADGWKYKLVAGVVRRHK